ncbi:MAG: acyclic terpene utilization AtuA family protein [Pirellulales bacterium]|nr:acyclic terpene utilization AtuA family protein [Pirellulales bacterium]
MPLRIANAAGFWGDNLDAPRLTVAQSQAGDAPLHYLTLEYLAELTMSVLARLKQKNPQAGYATDFITVLTSLLPTWPEHENLKIVTNAGGVNPLACVRAAGKVLHAAGRGNTTLALMAGDDLLPRIPELLAAGNPFINLDTGAPLSSLSAPLVAANAYLGAQPIVAALAQEAQIVITGRVADASLCVGPAMHEFGWKWDDWPRLAAATVAGHLIECGAQVTGGYLDEYQDINLADVGYPVAELDAHGDVVITKPPGTGGAVTTTTVAAQLLYEIGDPANYLTPDICANFATVELQRRGADRVGVIGCGGTPPTDFYKVSLAYAAGYTATGQLLVWGPDCVTKARACADILRHRVEKAGAKLRQFHVECLGTGVGVPGGVSGATPPEVVLRITAAADTPQAVERFTREFAPLITSGPAGLAGYAAGKPEVRPCYAYWPTLVPKDLCTPTIEVKSASQWAIE